LAVRINELQQKKRLSPGLLFEGLRHMKQLDRFYFMIHGFCWACIAANTPSRQPEDWMLPYLEREQRCATGWYLRLATIGEQEALVVIPFGPTHAANDFYSRASAVLGDRFFMLDAPDCLSPNYWDNLNQDSRQDVSRELSAAFTYQGYAWNKEELHTALHACACSRQFTGQLAQRDYYFDATAVSAEAWGASFEGCVTKYSLNLQRILGLSNVIDINYGLTVPDAAFLLPINDCETVLLDSGLRLYILSSGGQTVGLYTFTAHSPGDQPARVKLAVAPGILAVRSKQGIRLWPDPAANDLPSAPLGCYEPSQQVVQYGDGNLQVPISAGVVYRLAKAPAYVIVPESLSRAYARAILSGAMLN
jgi:hypothetical protein